MHYHLVSIKKPSKVKQEIKALKRIGARNRKPPATTKKQKKQESIELSELEQQAIELEQAALEFFNL